MLTPMFCITGQKIIPASHRSRYQKISHAINTPLNGIIGCLELLNVFGKSFTPEEIEDLTTGSLQAAKNLHRTMENLLLYNYLIDETNTQHANYQTITPSNVIDLQDNFIGYADQLGRNKDLRIHLQNHNSLKVCKSHLFKVMNELLDNACKNTLTGTPIDIKGELKEQSYDITISDQGPGMSTEQIVSIGPFVKFNRSEEGLGLGLFVASSLISRYGGLLQVKSENTKGLEALVSLPL
ncbi:MAG: HAMP domain-containing sensor histidine kinase [Bacteroidota bacterium]